MSDLRVMVHEMWDEVTMPYDPSRTVAEVKREALVRCRVVATPDSFGVKHGGALVLDESLAVSAAGIEPGAALIVLRTRRRAVR
jgi:predicted lipoprotein